LRHGLPMRAVEAAPEVRQPPNGPVVTFDEIMDALRTLDGEAELRAACHVSAAPQDVFPPRGNRNVFGT
jgi:hypothetical protein